jgi:hypothetical protein
MSHAARTLTAILGSMTVLLLSGPAEAKNIFEIIFGPPIGSQARRMPGANDLVQEVRARELRLQGRHHRGAEDVGML